MIPSEVIQQIVGTYIEDDLAPKPALIAWVQAECRNGCFRQAIAEFVKKQEEPLRADLVLVEKIESEKITLKVPGRLTDHESPPLLGLEVLFELNPVTLSTTRI